MLTSLPALSVGHSGLLCQGPPILGVGPSGSVVVWLHSRLLTSPWDSPPSVPLVVVWDIVRLRRRKGSGKCIVGADKTGAEDLGHPRLREVGWSRRRKTGLKPLKVGDCKVRSLALLVICRPWRFFECVSLK